MKHILFILALVVSNLGIGQDLNVPNKSFYSASVDATYGTITLGNDSEFTIPNGITITASTLDIENHATINLHGVLIIVGNIDVNNHGSLDVNNTGVMDVGGNVTAKDNSTLTFDGNIQIDGNLNIGNALLTVDGTVNVDGTFTGTVDSGAGTLTSGNLNNYNQPLPVKLLFATAAAKQATIEVKWATASETNNDFYTIKTSTDMVSWEVAATITGMGTSTFENEYAHSFQSNHTGSLYVQLSQTDYDGTTEILKTMAVTTQAANTRIYPMPLTSGQEWHIQGLQANDRVMVYNTNMQPVNNHLTLDKGIYYVVINNRKAHKVIVQ